MDKNLLPYFETVNDLSSQGDYLSAFGSEEVQGGICLHLVITWMHLFKNSANVAPNTIWQQMKTPNMITQIANNHRSYITNGFSVEDNIAFYRNLNCNENGPIIAGYGLLSQITNWCFNNGNMALLCIDLSVGDNLIGRHAIGMINYMGRFYMYDPNEGVMSVPFISKDELLDKISYIYEVKSSYQITQIKVYAIN